MKNTIVVSVSKTYTKYVEVEIEVPVLSDDEISDFIDNDEKTKKIIENALSTVEPQFYDDFNTWLPKEGVEWHAPVLVISNEMILNEGDEPIFHVLHDGSHTAFAIIEALPLEDVYEKVFDAVKKHCQFTQFISINKIDLNNLEFEVQGSSTHADGDTHEWKSDYFFTYMDKY